MTTIHQVNLTSGQFEEVEIEAPEPKRLGRGRPRRFTDAEEDAIALRYTTTGESFLTIARSYEKCDHSTIRLAVRRSAMRRA